jgi:hypothetical protein
MKWQDKLTKAELAHLRIQAGCQTLAAVKRNVREQAKMRKESDKAGLPPGIGEPCFDCLAIAQKLGLR